VVHPETDNLVLDNYKSLLDNGKLSDVVLQVRGKEFRAHKTILAAGSKVFAAMFENKATKEARESRVDITDIEPEVFERLLNYIYSGAVPKMDKLTAWVFIAADKVS